MAGTSKQNQVAFNVPASDPEERPKPELVTSAPAPQPHAPEQLVLRLLTLVTEMHAGQRSLSADLRELTASLPVQRKALSPRTQALHIHVLSTRRGGLCPCCEETQVCSEAGRADGSEFDHFFSRDQNRVTQTWLICSGCNRNLRNTDFKRDARSAFEAYQRSLKPFISRQIPLGLFEASAT